MSNAAEQINNLAKWAFPNPKLRRLFILICMVSGAGAILITLTFNQITKRELKNNQLKIEAERVSQIDKLIAAYYQKTYNTKDTLPNKLQTDLYLNQIAFLKTQRQEAVKVIDEVNSSPDAQVLIFTILLAGVTMTVLFFFSKTFKSSQLAADSMDKIRRNSNKVYNNKNEEFLEWVTTKELANEGLFGLDLLKARTLKKIYDLSAPLGEQQKTLLNNVISFTELKREVVELEKEKRAEIFSPFTKMQYRLQEECSRLNKQAVINLLLCFFLAFILMGFILYSLISGVDNRNNQGIYFFLMTLLPRVISILSMLTMFLYFTRLYKANIIDVKFYNNEITNIELKMTAVGILLINGDTDSINAIVKEFSTTERNSVMNKTQTTVELERSKLENEINKTYFDKMWELLKISNTKLTTEKK
jgi:hypothetical protein